MKERITQHDGLYTAIRWFASGWTQTFTNGAIYIVHYRHARETEDEPYRHAMSSPRHWQTI